MFNRNLAERQRGFGMIEVLVALMIFSIGLLGLIRLQTISLQGSTSAARRATAVILGQEILERMRINQAASLAGNYSVAFGASPTGGTLAGDDLAEWKSMLATNLPNGDGEVLTVAGIATVTVRWDESWDTDDDDGNAEIRLRSRP